MHLIIFIIYQLSNNIVSDVGIGDPGVKKVGDNTKGPRAVCPPATTLPFTVNVPGPLSVISDPLTTADPTNSTFVFPFIVTSQFFLY